MDTRDTPVRPEISGSCLEFFPNPHPLLPLQVSHTAFEFSHLCPFTGHPDYGEVSIVFNPTELCVELKTLKEYLQQFRDEKVSYEDAAGIIFEHLWSPMLPVSLVIILTMQGRGGIQSCIKLERTEGEQLCP